MITAVTGNVFQGERYYFLKGAPEIVLGDVRCLRQENRPATWRRWMSGPARACACWAWPTARMGRLDDYTGYTWVGLLGMEDPVREGVLEAIQVAQHAGIQVKMITGDYRRTAERIARSIGLMQEGDQTLEGDEVAALSDEQLQERVKQDRRLLPHPPAGQAPHRPGLAGPMARSPP